VCVCVHVYVYACTCTFGLCVPHGRASSLKEKRRHIHRMPTNRISARDEVDGVTHSRQCLNIPLSLKFKPNLPQGCAHARHFFIGNQHLSLRSYQFQDIAHATRVSFVRLRHYPQLCVCVCVCVCVCLCLCVRVSVRVCNVQPWSSPGMVYASFLYPCVASQTIPTLCQRRRCEQVLIIRCTLQHLLLEFLKLSFCPRP
jgi:hypothetical protein